MSDAAGMAPVAPAVHLSVEAQAYLSDPQPPLVGFDATDPVAVRRLRAELHPQWTAVNDEIEGPWRQRHETIAGVRVVRFAADEATLGLDRVIVHLHGGAYFLGTPLTSAVIAVPVAQHSGLPVVSVDYRLAPENPCPAAINDAASVVAALDDRGRVAAMFGESAGGGLAAATAVALREAGRALPDRLGLLSPWVDLSCSGDTYRTLAHVDPDFPDPADPHVWARAYAGGAVAGPEASPLFADLNGLPPTLIQVGGREILLSDSCRMHSALRDAGVASTLDVYDGLWHVWQMLPRLPEARQALRELSVFLAANDP